MKKYRITIIFLGKKITATVKADNKELAKQKIKDRLFFESVIEVDEKNDFLKQIFGMK